MNDPEFCQAHRASAYSSGREPRDTAIVHISSSPSPGFGQYPYPGEGMFSKQSIRLEHESPGLRPRL